MGKKHKSRTQILRDCIDIQKKVNNCIYMIDKQESKHNLRPILKSVSNNLTEIIETL